MILLDAYQSDVALGKIRYDNEQVRVLGALEHRRQILALPETFIEKYFGSRRDFRGIYCFGKVGIGKTYLMDLFCSTLPRNIFLRLHFHAFMQKIHFELKDLQGVSNPLNKIAKKLARTTRVICLDEFHVSDICDAMLLAGLLQALFENRMMLITTSNVAPADLYRNGLQRGRFLPAIRLLHEMLEVIQLGTETDYRLEKLKEAGVFFSPLNERTDAKMSALYAEITLEHEQLSGLLEINGRQITFIRRTRHVVWFDFSAICHYPRSQADYLAIAEEYDTVFVSGVPIIHEHALDTVTYFIHMIDIFYDKGVKLILSTAAPLAALYPSGPKGFEFKRTLSRLEEMQSIAYLHRQHAST